MDGYLSDPPKLFGFLQNSALDSSFRLKVHMQLVHDCI